MKSKSELIYFKGGLAIFFVFFMYLDVQTYITNAKIWIIIKINPIKNPAFDFMGALPNPSLKQVNIGKLLFPLLSNVISEFCASGFKFDKSEFGKHWHIPVNWLIVIFSISQVISWHITSFAWFPKNIISLLSFRGISTFSIVKLEQKSLKYESVSLKIFISFTIILLAIFWPKEFIIFVKLDPILKSSFRHSGQIWFKFINVFFESYISI